MGIVRIYGDEMGFRVTTLDELFQDIDLDIGDNYLSDGEYTFTIHINDGYELISAERTNSAGELTPIRNNEFSMIVKSDLLEIYVVTENVVPDRDVSGFNKLYKVDKALLNSIAGERFSGGGNDIDLADFFINILELPFLLDESILGDENNIRLGGGALQTKAFEIMKDLVTIDLGVIYVDKKYNNSYDYMNTVATLHLPFTNSIDLELEYVIGHYTGIQYIIDLYTGDVTINISSSRTNKIIRSENTKIGRDIPFVRRIGATTVNRLSSYNGVNNGVLVPYIEVIRNKPHNIDNVFKSDISVYGLLNDFTGYVTVNNILLSTSANASEKDKIISMLKSGVYIK